jgi:FtsZ-binding cell division protein ZapB
MNVTNHCLKRYAERLKNVLRDDLEVDMAVNKDLYIGELNKMFKFSKLLYTGRFNKTNENTNYYIVDNIILVVDLANTKIITLYRIEFGFGREVDKNILVGLLRELDNAETEYIKAMDIVKEQKNDMEYKILSLEEDISSTVELLNTLKLSLNELKNIKQTITLEEDKCRISRDKIAKKLVYSNIYRNAMEEY